MIVAPSILAADFAHLAQSIDIINRSSAGMVHCDVMDGTFVPNISFGFPVIDAVHKVSQKPLDVHLMICNPDRYVSRVRDCGAYIMNIHVEACTHLNRTVESIHQAGMKAAVTLNPSTPVAWLEEIIAELDMVLLMSVDPGFGGQSFIAHTLDKIRRLKALIDRSGSHALIEIDGGINAATGRQCADAGADILVTGSYVFRSSDPDAAIEGLARLNGIDMSDFK